MLGYLLARAGVQVTVLEKHADFLRDFRGDTVHPSTLEILYELELLDDFLRLPHQKIIAAGGVIGDFVFKGPDFRHVPGRCKFVALMPQWDFLDFLADRAKRFPAFHLRMQHEAVDLITEGSRITGVVAHAPGERTVQIAADLVVGCDGRYSTTRMAGQLAVREFGVPFDVAWFRLSRKPGDPDQVLGNVNYGKMLILLNRGDYFQAGLIIRKGSFDEIKERGLDGFRSSIVQMAPYLQDRGEELRDWEQIKLLTVQLNRLHRWYRPGLLCIGDAAHAMSPVGGVGINLAIQDAVATSNLLIQPLLDRRVTEKDLAAVQKRREFPTRVTRAAQVGLHRLIAGVFQNPGPLKAPGTLKIVTRVPGLHRVLGRAVGIGVRPEHVQGARPAPARKGAAAAIVAGVAAGVAVAILAVRLLQSNCTFTNAWSRKLSARKRSFTGWL